MGLTPPRSGRGHLVLPHTADVRLEAWGPDLGACIEEAVAGLVEVFADTAGASSEATVEVALETASPDEALVDALQEVIYRLDVDGLVPVGARLVADLAAGSLAGEFSMAPLERVEAVGPEPKAVARSGLEVVTDESGTVTARVTIDV